jgi:RHS repeat-associated protein
MAYLSDYLGRMEKITYPDGEAVQYEYDGGGQIVRATGTKGGETYPYVNDIGYDRFGQRVYIEYGNGVKTWYTYDEQRRWLDAIETKEPYGGVYQRMRYDFNVVGNINGYTNEAGQYRTTQSYQYDGLYQLIEARGETRQYQVFGGSVEEYRSSYRQEFSFDGIGNMTGKASSAEINRGAKLGSDLNYNNEYEYYRAGGITGHRAERIGDMYYRCDGNGNVVEERQGGHREEGAGAVPYSRDGDVYEAPYAFIMSDPANITGGAAGGGADPNAPEPYQRDYAWDYQNRLIQSSDRNYVMRYRYGFDNQRTVKYREGTGNETLYFNNMWQRSSGAVYGQGWLETKHIFVGETRIASKNGYGGPDQGYEAVHQYWYHGDHLGSAQLITNHEGKQYERIEYTPYGETWIEKKYENGITDIPYRFTSKELDGETGLYYYGARYLDPRTSRWLSGDPALGEYLPGAPVDDEARKNNQNLPGGGGIFNLVNLHVYHYAGNNPVKYVDPDGRINIALELCLDGGGGNSKSTNAYVGYSTAREAAVAMLDFINPISINTNVEYAGLIYQNKSDEKYYASVPIPGDKLGSNPWESPVPSDARVVGDYHTHGDYSTVGPDGLPMRTDDPNKDAYGSDTFSNFNGRGDIPGIINDAKRLNEPEYRGYLGTPSGKFKEYNPYANSIGDIN